MSKSIKQKVIQLLHRALLTLITGGKEQYRDYWQWRFINWTKIGPPWRMSKTEEKHYAEIVGFKNVTRPKILILGATPALRIIAARTDAETVCADFSIPMLENMGRFVEKEAPGSLEKETWFIGDWLKIPFPENYFDFVLGDMVLPFISRGERGIFLEKIKKTLSSHGKFVTRTHLVSENLQRKTIEECLEIFFRSGGETPRVLNIFLLDWSFEPRTGLTNRQKITAAVSDYISRCTDQKTRLLLNDFLKEYSSGIDFNFENREIIERDFNEHFMIPDIFSAGDYHLPNASKFFPIYILTRK